VASQKRKASCRRPYHTAIPCLDVCVASTEIQTKKDTKTDNAKAEVIVLMVVDLPQGLLCRQCSMSPFFALG